MSRKFLTAIDLSKNELQNAAIHNLPSAPAAPVKGQLYFNTTAGDNTLYWWDGTTWVAAKATATVAFGPVVPETTFGGTAADGVASTAARSDHKHGNPVHDAAAHAAIPISALAPATGAISMGGFVINNVGTPVAPTDAANKGYVDNAIAGLAWKDSVRVATTANIALTGFPVLDTNVTPVAGDRILVKNQTAGAENGIYVAAAGAWTRAIDADTGAELLAAATYIEEGQSQRDTAWVVSTNAPITVGTTAIVWAQFAGDGSVQAGDGMTRTGNVLNILADAPIDVLGDSIRRAPITGDVSVPLNVNTSTINNDVVTNAKLADMPAATFKGNPVGVAADPQDLTVAQMQAALNILTTTAAAGIYNKTFAVDCAAALFTTVTHNFNTRDVQVQVYRTTTPWDTVECDVERTSVNTVDVRFATAPTAAQYRIVVQGIDG